MEIARLLEMEMELQRAQNALDDSSTHLAILAGEFPIKIHEHNNVLFVGGDFFDPEKWYNEYKRGSDPNVDI